MFRLSLSALPRQAIATRSFASSSRLLASAPHANDPEILEKEKARNLHGVKKGDPNWNEKLASDSEASIKADQHDDKSPEQLQKETAYKAHQHHGEGGSAASKNAPEPQPTGSEEAVKADQHVGKP